MATVSSRTDFHIGAVGIATLPDIYYHVVLPGNSIRVLRNNRRNGF